VASLVVLADLQALLDCQWRERARDSFLWMKLNSKVWIWYTHNMSPSILIVNKLLSLSPSQMQIPLFPINSLSL
jgi:hypothetical protein